MNALPSPETRFADLYERYQRYVASYCARRTPADRVEDAVSEVFLVAWRRIDDVPDSEDALRWLYGVAYRVLGQQWRTASRRRVLHEKLLKLGVEPVPIPEQVLVVGEEYLHVTTALRRLSSRDREILLLGAWEELSHGDIAKVLGIRPDAVRQRFHKAKQRLTREYNRIAERTVYRPAAEKGSVS